MRFQEVTMNKSGISNRKPLKTQKTYGCIVPIVISGQEVLMAHYVPCDSDKIEDIELFFQSDLSFLERTLFSTNIRKAFILGGEKYAAILIQKYFKRMGIEILEVTHAPQNDLNGYPRRDIFAFPETCKIYEISRGRILHQFTY